MTEEKQRILHTEGISVWMRKEKKEHRLLQDVSISLASCGCEGIIGESGCGKSLFCRALLGVLPKQKWRIEGKVFLGGKELPIGDDRGMDRFRGREISLILQNPLEAFDPRLKIEGHFLEGIPWREKRKMKDRALELLDQMQIRDPKRVMESYPFQLSGGMLQRILIGLSLLENPKVLIADEPTTALDATVQAEILRILKNLQRQRKLSILLVSHDLEVISSMADGVSVMYGGQIVEKGTVQQVCQNPLHPYTIGLLGSQPVFSKERLHAMSGQPPRVGEMEEKGCRFAPRCPVKSDACLSSVPQLKEVQNGHLCRCWRIGGTE